MGGVRGENKGGYNYISLNTRVNFSRINTSLKILTLITRVMPITETRKTEWRIEGVGYVEKLIQGMR